MRIKFNVTEAGFEDDEYALICGFSGTDSGGVEHYLNLQREAESGDPDEDWGVHIEYDDQINGQYDRVKQCRLSRDRLSVDLVGQLGTLVGVEGFDLALGLDGESYAEIRVGLTRSFRGISDVLIIEG